MWVKLKQAWKGKAIDELIDVAADDGGMLIKAGVAEAAGENPTNQLVADAVAKSVQAITGQMTTAFDTVMKDFAKSMTLSHKGANAKIFGDGGNGDPKKTLGHFLHAVATRNQKALEELGSKYQDWSGAESKDLNSQTGTAGGYTVPVQFLARLMMVSSEASIVEKRATIIPMTSKVTEIPALNQTTAPTAGQTSFFGGVQANWTEEAATLGQEEPNFKQVRIENYELSGFTYLSNTLLADNAVGLEAVLTMLFGGAVGWHKDYAFLRGVGAGQPLGILNWAGLKSITRSAASAFALADSADMYAGLLRTANSGYYWAMHPTVLPKLLQMTAGNTGSNLIYLDNARETPQYVLHGYPVEITEKLPALNTLGDVLLCNGPQYVIGDRQGLEIAYSEHFRFTNNQGTWRFVTRVGGRPWMDNLVTLSDATSTLSPFLALAAG